MRASREQFAENRQPILEVAGRLFREKGFDGVGVDGIMDDLRRYLFFEQTNTSQDAGRAFLKRQAQRTVDRDPESSQQTVGAQFTAIVAWGTDGDPRSARRLQQITQQVLVVNGKNDIMVPTINSYTLFQRLPNAQLSLYPDSGHGGLFQHGETFVDEGIRFLHE